MTRDDIVRENIPFSPCLLIVVPRLVFKTKSDFFVSSFFRKSFTGNTSYDTIFEFRLLEELLWRITRHDLFMMVIVMCNVQRGGNQLFWKKDKMWTTYIML